MNPLLKLVIIVLLLPVGALFGAWVYSELWHYLLAPQYGDGPTYESWFGIACIIGLLTIQLKPDDPEKKNESARDFFASIAVSYARRLLALALALFVRAVLGWA